MKTLFSISLAGMFAFTHAQLTSINESFSDFVINQTALSGRKYGNLPQHNWTSSSPYPAVYVSQNAAGSDNKYISVYNSGTDTPHYLFTPELASTEGTLTFVAQSNGEAQCTIQIGTIASPTDLGSFTPIGSLIAPTATNTSYEVEISANTNQYIAFKVLPPAGKHSFVAMDDVVFTPKNLSVSNTELMDNRFAVNGNDLVFSNDNIHLVKIFSSHGGLVATEKVIKKKVSISKLNAGVYIFIMEDNSGNITKSKFIKN